MSQDNLNDSDTVHAAGDAIGKLIQGLRQAIKDFQFEATPENFGKIVTAIGAYGISGSKVWKDVASFARRHPVQSAVGAGLAFFAIKGLLSARRESPDGDKDSDKTTPQWRMQNYH